MTSNLTNTQALSPASYARQWIIRHQVVLANLLSLVTIQIAMAGVGFLTRLGVANALGLETFGALAFAVAVGTYGQTFVQLGFDKSLVRDLVHFPNRMGELIQASLVLRLGLLVVFLFVILGTAGIVAPSRVGRAWEMCPAVVATVIGAFQLNGVYDAWKEMRRHALYCMAERFLYFGLVWLVILLPFATLSLSQVGLFMLATVAVGLWLQYRWAMPRIDFRPVEGVLAASRFVVRSNFWIWLAAISSLSIEHFSQIILGCYAGKSELGEYSAAWLLVSLGLLILSQVSRVGSEAVARYTRTDKSLSERRRFTAGYVILMAVMGLAVGLPCIILSRPMLMVFRPEYGTAASTLRILGFLPIFYGPYLAALQYIISSRLHKTYVILITVASAASVGLSFCLIPRMGSAGAAASAVASVAIALVLFLSAAGWHLKSLRASSG